MRFRGFDEMWYMFFESDMRGKYRTIFFIRTLGNILILSSVLFVFTQFYPVIAAEIGYRWHQLTHPVEQQQADLPDSIRHPQPFHTHVPTATPRPLPPLDITPVDTDFGLVIPKIRANARVVSNVDPFNSQEYSPALLKGVAHARGTKFPGEVGNVYMFAHNTLNVWDIPKYNAVFFLLHNLEVGDRITTFYQQARYDYIVFDKKIFPPNDLSPLDTQYLEPVLSLQTCWPPGTTWQRLVVRAKLDR